MTEIKLRNLVNYKADHVICNIIMMQRGQLEF